MMSLNIRRYDTIDPHCVPVTPGHGLQVHTLPNGNFLLTVFTYHVDTDGETIGVVTARIEWRREQLADALHQTQVVLDAGELATMAPANALAG